MLNGKHPLPPSAQTPPNFSLQMTASPHPSGEAIMLVATFGNLAIQVAIPVSYVESVREALSTAKKNIPLVKIVGGGAVDPKKTDT